MIQAVNDEITFFDCLDKKILFEEIRETLQNNQIDTQDKADLFEDYLVSVWIHGDSREMFHDLFLEYLETKLPERPYNKEFEEFKEAKKRKKATVFADFQKGLTVLLLLSFLLTFAYNLIQYLNQPKGL